MKRFKIGVAVMAAIMTIGNIVPAYALETNPSKTVVAGVWTKGISKDAWWYNNGDGSYLKDGWHWVDGNNDGVAECYYFDNNGWMLSNTKTPDGYNVNENGAWVNNGAVQTKSVQTVNNQAQNTSVKNSDAPLAKYLDTWMLRTVYGTITDPKIARRGDIYDERVQEALTGVRSKDTLEEEDLKVYNYVKDFLNSFDFEHATNREKLEQIKKSLKGTHYEGSQPRGLTLMFERYGNCSAYSTYTVWMCRAVNVPFFIFGNSSHECIYAQLDNGKWIGIDNGDFKFDLEFDRDMFIHVFGYDVLKALVD